MVLRHLLAILLLPVLAAAVMPYWLLSRSGANMGSRGSSLSLVWLLSAAGAALFILGFGLFLWCVALFAKVGGGTLAPWDPTRNLVAVGPYRYVRNPMITGVALLLAGQSLFFRSWAVGGWAIAFVLINHLYFVLSEEPGLESRFGEPYRRYKAEVPRWLPRITGSRSP